MSIRSKLLSLILIPKIVIVGLLLCFLFFDLREAKINHYGDSIDVLRWDIRLAIREFRLITHGHGSQSTLNELLNKAKEQIQDLENNGIDLLELKMKLDVFIAKIDFVKSDLSKFVINDEADILMDSTMEDVMTTAFNLSISQSLEARKYQLHLIIIFAITLSVIFIASLSLSIVVSRSIQVEVKRIKDLDDKLTQSNERLSRFVYFASHDLREPARMVACYLKMLSEKVIVCGSQCGNGKELQELVDFGVSGSNRIESLLDSLLAYSCLDNEIKFKKTQICHEVINVAIENLKSVINESKAEIEFTCDNPDPTDCWHCITNCDPIQMVLVFQNILANSIKYRKDDVAPKILISAKHLEKEVLFCIEDNGIGIPKESVNEHLFDLFKRLHSRDKYPGSGIGLASCKNVIDRHGGKIWVESEWGVGSKFSFTIPN